QLIELRHDRVADLAPAEAEVGAPQAAHAIDQAVAVDVPDPASLSAHDDIGKRIAHRAGMGQRVEQPPGVLCFEFVVAESAHGVSPWPAASLTHERELTPSR